MRPSRGIVQTMGGLCVGALGCGPGGGLRPDATFDSGPVPGGIVELGAGGGAFRQLEAETVLPLVAGPQGGFHFILHARERDMEPGDPLHPGRPENPSTRFSSFLADGRQVDKLYPAYRLGYEPSEGEDGWYELPSGRILQIENSEVPAIYGQRARIRVEVDDVALHHAVDERWVEVQPFGAGVDGGMPDADIPMERTDGAP